MRFIMKLKHFSYFIAFLAYAATASCRKAPEWSTAYSVSGSLYLPYAELLEPFDAWYDADEKQSRIDYYQGTVKTYQLGNEGQYGTTLEIVPVTTESVTNQITCFRNDGSSSALVTPQAILPNLTDFKFAGTEVKNGYQCEVWRDIVKSFDRISTYTIYIRRQKNPSSPSLSVAIPVRYEMKGYNTLIGSHYDHYYLNYENFVIGKPSSDIFQIPKDVSCGGTDDFTDHPMYNANPMKEFIDRNLDHVDHAWEKYKTAHDKSYNSHKEHTERRDIFNHNLRYIHSSNRQGLGYTLKVNHLADRKDSELKYLRGRLNKPGYNGGEEFPYGSIEIEQMANDLPQNIDWRIRGAVTPVKDQATCGSCWSFGTTGAMEGAYFLKSGQLVSFSQQALVDCSWGFGNNGCDGGDDYLAYQWIMKHGGIPSDEDYGYYKGQDGYCHTNTVKMMAPITGHVNVTSGDENALRLALFKQGPISVSIDASHKSFSFYSNGVYFEKECKNGPDDLDHTVLAVGYGSLNGENYWLIKNSWSNYWGNQGYVLMSSKDNNCGVMTIPTYVNM